MELQLSRRSRYLIGIARAIFSVLDPMLMLVGISDIPTAIQVVVAIGIVISTIALLATSGFDLEVKKPSG